MYVPTEAMPDVRNVSFEIRATIDHDVANGDGVIASCGDSLMGYALYIKDGFLRFHYNAAGARSSVSSTTPLPAGHQVVSFVFVKTGPLRGTGRLFTGDDELSAGPIGPTIGVIEPADDTSCVVTIGGDPDWIARYLFSLELEFDVLEPPEVNEELRTLANQILTRLGSKRATV